MRDFVITCVELDIYLCLRLSVYVPIYIIINIYNYVEYVEVSKYFCYAVLFHKYIYNTVPYHNIMYRTTTHQTIPYHTTMLYCTVLNCT